MRIAVHLALSLLATTCAFAGGLPLDRAGAELPGPRTDGSVLLPNQWSLRPAGRQVALGDFPVNIAVHPGGQFAAVMHSGHGPHEIAVVDLQDGTVVARQHLSEGFYGLEFSRDGRKLYASGSSDEVIHVFSFVDGLLTEATTIPLRKPDERGIPCGLAVSADGKWLYAANVWGQKVSKVDLAHGTVAFDLVPEIVPKMMTAGLTAPEPDSEEAPFPYACVLDESRHELYVSLWARSAVAVIDLKSSRVVAHWTTGEHPNEMAAARSGHRLFVANGNHNTVTVLDTRTGKTIETLVASLAPDALPGSTPGSLALSPDEKTLFVANACNNNVAVFDVSTVGKSHSLGFIPVGWYPTSVRVTPDGRQLLVANGKGLTSKPNPKGPVPGERRTAATQSITELFPGTLSIIDLPRGRSAQDQYAAWTADCWRCTPQQSVTQVRAPADGPIPASPGGVSPIKYCIYIIKENRTYDQVFGDLPQGNGDSNLCLFPDKVTPNHHELARQFVLFDNFYVDAEVSADGHEWSMGAYASDFVEKTWPLNYGHGRDRKIPYPGEGAFPIARPAGGYLWDRARAAGISYRSYGEFIFNGATTNAPGFTKTAALREHFDPWFRSFDLEYPDAKRADRFIAEFHRFEAAGGLPRLQILRLPNDHTAGASPGRPTPAAYLADNDRSLGRVVEAVSHSKFWPETAIFVIEDDAQDGPDHVDAHRSVALVISPYTRRGAVDSTMYSTSSMLRTMELILGLAPMSQFDAAATPMFNAFQATADPKPYDALEAGADASARNGSSAWGSELAVKMDFSREDAADEHLLNEMVWRSVKGAASAMPAPVRAAFVVLRTAREDD